jgi:hypothetical protein
LEGNDCSLIEVLYQHFIRGTEENHENNLVRIAGVSTEIQTEHTPKYERYRYANWLGIPHVYKINNENAH